MKKMNFDEMIQNNFELFGQYQEYIMDNADSSEVNICNGDTLLRAAENEYLLEEFKQAWIANHEES